MIVYIISMSEQNYLFEIDFLVRDYECDLQGIVNNSVYQNYLEHARHELLQAADIDFAELHKMGVDLVVTRSELDYRFPLTSKDRFVIGINFHREGKLRFVFDQDIYRLDDRKTIVNAKIFGVALKNGRPFTPDEIMAGLINYRRP
jgi:acyl-CoA thioester hydrolase